MVLRSFVMVFEKSFSSFSSYHRESQITRLLHKAPRKERLRQSTGLSFTSVTSLRLPSSEGASPKTDFFDKREAQGDYAFAVVTLFGEICLRAVGVGEQGFAQGSEGATGVAGGVALGAVAQGFADLRIAVIDGHIHNGTQLGGQ